MCGNAALTSGHHDSPVSGWSEVVNVMKNGSVESPGKGRAVAACGNVKLDMIGMIAGGLSPEAETRVLIKPLIVVAVQTGQKSCFGS